MRKILVVITARASFSRIRTALIAMQAHEGIALSVVLTASAARSDYGDIQKQLLADGIETLEVLPTLAEGTGLASQVKTTGASMLALVEVMERLAPDAVLTIADRHETMATAVTAAYLNIPLIHLQGGEVTGNIDEKVRHSISKLADVHLVCTQRAREYLIRMGERPETIYVTGCPSCDLAETVRQKLRRNPKTELCVPGPAGMEICQSGGYYVLLIHPVTDDLEHLEENVSALLETVEKTGIKTLWVRGNTDAGGSEVAWMVTEYLRNHPGSCIRPIRPMDSEDFLELLLCSRGILGNSSVGIRECSYLGVPALNAGSRQNGRERGRNVVDTGFGREALAQAMARMEEKRGKTDSLYGWGDAGKRIARCVAACPLTSRKTLTYVNEEKA